MDKMACTMIFVEALGLRPTAEQAPRPINPTPIAAPSAARPTCTLPYKAPVISVSFLRFLVLTNQEREDGGQQHEDQRLHQTYQQFHEVEGDRQQPAETRDHARHDLEHVLAGEDVAVKTEAE